MFINIAPSLYSLHFFNSFQVIGLVYIFFKWLEN